MVPTTMRALVFERPAPDAAATSVCSVATPVPGEGQVLIEVSHAGLNFKDVMARRGDAGYVASWPFVPGLEVAGTVAAVGPGVAEVNVGDRVAALTNAGGLAEYAIARADLVAAVPDGLSSTAAAAAPGALTTAALLVDFVARVRDDDTIVVHSAAGAVGTAVAAIARTHARVRLVGTVGDGSRVAAAERAGYDHVVVRGPRLAARIAELVGARAVDIVLDPQGTTQLDTDLDVLAPGGRVVVFGNAGGAPLAALPPAGRLVGASAAVGGFSLQGTSGQRPDLIARTMAGVLGRLAAGTVGLDITELDGLEAGADAQQSLADGAGDIKYVVRVV